MARIIGIDYGLRRVGLAVTDRGGIMPFKYKIDVLEALKAAGYSTYRIRKEKIFAEGTLQNLRDGVIVAQGTLEKLCELLDCQPGDILIFQREHTEG